MATVRVGTTFAQRLSAILTGSGVPWEAIRPISDVEALVITDDFSKTEDWLWGFGFKTEWEPDGLRVTQHAAEDCA